MVDWFANRCPAGPLELCKTVYYQPHEQSVEWLGYLLDARRQGLGIADGPLRKFEARLSAAEQIDQYSEDRWPHNTWRELRDFRAGMSAAPSSELSAYVEAAGDLAKMHWHPVVAHLHANVLAASGTLEADIIDGILSKFERRKRRRRR